MGFLKDLPFFVSCFGTMAILIVIFMRTGLIAYVRRKLADRVPMWKVFLVYFGSAILVTIIASSIYEALGLSGVMASIVKGVTQGVCLAPISALPVNKGQKTEARETEQRTN